MFHSDVSRESEVTISIYRKIGSSTPVPKLLPASLSANNRPMPKQRAPVHATMETILLGSNRILPKFVETSRPEDGWIPIFSNGSNVGEIHITTVYRKKEVRNTTFHVRLKIAR